jgi:hypothetical protein
VCGFPPCIVDQMCHLRRDSRKRALFCFGRVGLEILQQEGSIDGEYSHECFLVELQEVEVARANNAIALGNLVDQVFEFDVENAKQINITVYVELTDIYI